MSHVGILAANPEGATLCFLPYCREGAERLGGHTYPASAARRRGGPRPRHLRELVDGAPSSASRTWFARAVLRLAERGTDAVALVSTELPVLLAAEESPLPVIDSTRLVALAALAVALGDEPLPTWRGGPRDPSR